MRVWCNATHYARDGSQGGNQKSGKFAHFALLRRTKQVRGERFRQRQPTMRLDLATPALLFPAISLLLLAHTNRFLVTATRLRDLGAKYRSAPEPGLALQLENLYYRVRLIRWAQGLGVGAMLMSLVSMLLTLAAQVESAFFAFAFGLVLLMSS